MPVIDVHAHYYPESYLALLKARGYPTDTIYSNANPDESGESDARTYKLHDRGLTDLDLRIAAMDAQDVDVHALSMPPPYVFARSGAPCVIRARSWNS